MTVACSLVLLKGVSSLGMEACYWQGKNTPVVVMKSTAKLHILFQMVPCERVFLFNLLNVRLLCFFFAIVSDRTSGGFRIRFYRYWPLLSTFFSSLPSAPYNKKSKVPLRHCFLCLHYDACHRLPSLCMVRQMGLLKRH